MRKLPSKITALGAATCLSCSLAVVDSMAESSVHNALVCDVQGTTEIVNGGRREVEIVFYSDIDHLVVHTSNGKIFAAMPQDNLIAIRMRDGNPYLLSEMNEDVRSAITREFSHLFQVYKENCSHGMEQDSDLHSTKN